MDTSRLASALRNIATTVDLFADDLGSDVPERAEMRDAAELIRVLARVTDGQPVARAFGSPGDWGRATPIGAALAARG